MNYTDATDGLHIRFAHHDGTRAGGRAAPVFRLRPHLSFVHDDTGKVVDAVEDGWDRVVVVPHPPYNRGAILPFTPENADAFVPAAIPLAKVPARSTRSRRGR